MMEDGQVRVDMGPPVLKAVDVPTILPANQVTPNPPLGIPAVPSTRSIIHAQKGVIFCGQMMSYLIAKRHSSFIAVTNFCLPHS